MNFISNYIFKSGTSPKKAPTKGVTLLFNHRGQLSIFFAITLVLLLTVTAFIINVGLYVKAKINLQNAVDAAAWSGAAVQARQLTDIGYLNWEMRNVYKEWMFKYYILGQLSLPQVKDPGANPRTPSMDFYMKSFPAAVNPGEDPYPFPSICMDFSANSNICRLYEVPGLPKFPAAGHVGTDQTSQALQDVIASKKGKDCTNRSMINLQTAMLWAYSPEPLPAFSAWPQVAADKPGAYPQALELAMRIRNLEKIVNEPPVTVCADTSMGGCKSYDSWLKSDSGGPGPHKERTTKAYWAAVRNLGNSADSEMASSFKLQELSPTFLPPGDKTSLSNLLIPADRLYNKYYLDLKIYLLNLVTFYTAFVSNRVVNVGGVDEEGQCAATKIGMPIPGYPLGFEKSQNIMTYYAVKGEVKFKGLLNPFADNLPHLTAYAAAKPFGGRIGPKLFSVSQSGSLVTLRSGAYPRSHNYVMGLDLYPRKSTTGRSPPCTFAPGDAIPFNCGSSEFWVWKPDFAEGIGGSTSSQSSGTKFTLPSLIYEYLSTMPQSIGDAIKIINQRVGNVGGDIPSSGLFDPEQFKLFRSNLASSGNVDSNDINLAIKNVRAPTRYDSLNYLIPTDSSLVDTVPQVPGGTNYKVYAPFWGPETYLLYNSASATTSLVTEFLKDNEPAVQTFIDAMKNVADAMILSGAAQGGNSQQIYKEASEKMYLSDGTKLKCGSVAGDFSSFYLSNPSKSQIYPDYGNPSAVPPASKDQCPPQFLATLQDAWGKKTANDSLYYYGTFSYNSNKPAIGFDSPEKYLNAWMPGVRHGAKEDGTIVHPFISGGASAAVLSRRNYYSTKLISIQSVKSSEDGSFTNSTFARYTEGNYQTKIGDEGLMLNPISDNLPRIKQ